MMRHISHEKAKTASSKKFLHRDRRYSLAVYHWYIHRFTFHRIGLLQKERVSHIRAPKERDGNEAL